MLLPGLRDDGLVPALETGLAAAPPPHTQLIERSIAFAIGCTGMSMCGIRSLASIEAAGEPVMGVPEEGLVPEGEHDDSSKPSF